MARRFVHVADLAPDLKVPYSARKRPDRKKWVVCFRDREGKTVRVLTIHEAPDKVKSPPPEFFDDAKDIIRKVWCPPSLFPALVGKTWSDHLKEVEAKPGIRPETLRSFKEGTRAVGEILPEVEGPHDVTAEVVQRFCSRFLVTPDKRNKIRTRVTLSYYVRALSAFTNHIIDGGYVSSNPWRGVRTEQAGKKKRKKKRAPTEDQFNHFIGWVVGRFPDWTSLRALIELKSVSACRTADLCQLKTAQLRNGRITFTADIVKTDGERSLPLEADLYKMLQTVAGPVWLWEKMFAELPKYRKQSNGLPTSFSWKTIKSVVNNIFRQYNDAHPDRLPRLTPHGLKRRAVTQTVRALGSTDEAANALDIHPQTAKACYLDEKLAFDSDAAMIRISSVLRPKWNVPANTAPITHHDTLLAQGNKKNKP